MALRMIKFENEELEHLDRLANEYKNRRWLTCNNSRRRRSIELLSADENLSSASVQLLAYVVSENNFKWRYGNSDKSSIHLLWQSCKVANGLMREFWLFVLHVVTDAERQPV